MAAKLKMINTIIFSLWRRYSLEISAISITSVGDQIAGRNIYSTVHRPKARRGKVLENLLNSPESKLEKLRNSHSV